MLGLFPGGLSEQALCLPIDVAGRLFDGHDGAQVVAVNERGMNRPYGLARVHRPIWLAGYIFYHLL